MQREYVIQARYYITATAIGRSRIASGWRWDG